MTDVRGAKVRANRAVAALSEATNHTPPFIPRLDQGVAAGHHRPIVRPRDGFRGLELARRQRCPLAEQRAALADLQEKPKPRDELAVLPDAAIVAALDYLGPLSTDAAALSAACARAEALSLAHSTHTASEVCLVPSMLPTPSSLAEPRVLDALTRYFSADKRGHTVESLALVESRYAATSPAGAHLPTLRLPVVLQLVSQLTYLRSLDLRGAAWDGPHNRPAVAHFLSDLHLVAPRLHTLKVGAELCQHWTTGWWRLHTDLVTLVVGSRAEAAACTALVTGTAGGTGQQQATAASLALRLDPDVYTMLASSDRPWRLKLWCRLARESVVRLLGVPCGPSTAATTAAAPASPSHASASAPPVFPSLTELCVNLQGNTEVCGWVTESEGMAAASSAAIPSGADGLGTSGGVLGAGDSLRQGQLGAAAAPSQPPRPKGKRGVPGEVVGDTPVFPNLTTLTIANVEERVMSATEVLGRFFVLAPMLSSFNVCNTMRLPAPEKAKAQRKPKLGVSAAS